MYNILSSQIITLCLIVCISEVLKSGIPLVNNWSKKVLFTCTCISKKEVINYTLCNNPFIKLRKYVYIRSIITIETYLTLDVF